MLRLRGSAAGVSGSQAAAACCLPISTHAQRVWELHGTGGDTGSWPATNGSAAGPVKRRGTAHRALPSIMSHSRIARDASGAPTALQPLKQRCQRLASGGPRIGEVPCRKVLWLIASVRGLSGRRVTRHRVLREMVGPTFVMALAARPLSRGHFGSALFAAAPPKLVEQLGLAPLPAQTCAENCRCPCSPGSREVRARHRSRVDSVQHAACAPFDRASSSVTRHQRNGPAQGRHRLRAAGLGPCRSRGAEQRGSGGGAQVLGQLRSSLTEQLPSAPSRAAGAPQRPHLPVREACLQPGR